MRQEQWKRMKQKWQGGKEKASAVWEEWDKGIVRGGEWDKRTITIKERGKMRSKQWDRSNEGKKEKTAAV